jgi:outer membrane lipoprotein SlyB
MRVLRIALVLSSLVGMAACDRPAQQTQDQKPDLSWLDTMDLRSPVQKVDSAAALSPAEAALVSTAQPTTQAVATPVRHTSSTTSHRSSTRRSSSSGSSSGTYASSGTYSAPRTETVKHTRRDAVIGGAGGAVIGAVAGGSRHRVKGAVIGGVAGAIAGAVIGNNVDKSQRVHW